MLRTKLPVPLIAMLNLALAFGQQPQAPTPSPQKNPPTQNQSPEIDSQDVVKITTNLVQIDAAVTKDGKQVTDLQAADFELFEDGKPQTITNFSYVSNVIAPLAAAPAAKSDSSKDKTAPPLPPVAARPTDTRRTIALVIDDLGMSFQSMADARRQARKFVSEQLEPNDLVAIIHTSGEVGALQQFTTDRRMLFSAIDRLRWYPCSRAGVHVFAPYGTAVAPRELPCGSSENVKATLQALRFIIEGMRDLAGRKSLVLMSDHLPVETQEPATTTLNPGDGDLSDERTNYYGQLKKIAELAIRSSVVIYTVDTRGLAYTGITAMDTFKGVTSVANAREIADRMNATMSTRSRAMIANREGSELIAKETGGFLVRNSNDFGLKRIADDQKGYYLLGYRPTDETFNRKFHHIKVTLKRHGLTIRTRNGFYGVTEESTRLPEVTASDQIKKALMSPFGKNEIEVRLTTIFTNFESGSLLRSLIYIKAQDLAFVDDPDGGHTAKFDLGIVLFGENGSVRDEQSRLVTLQLQNDGYQRALKNGIVYSLDIPLRKSGAFQFRIALRDQSSTKIGSAGQFIQVPNLTNGKLELSGLALFKEIPNKPEGASATEQDAADVVLSGPAVRQFHQGDKLIYGYWIYNAPADATTHQPQLTAQIRIFRDGRAVLSGDANPIEVNAQTDLKRISHVGRLQLGADFQPGEYVLQVIVTDGSAKGKPQISSQWLDFEIVK
jgi:VWFA-related protein